MIQKYTHCRLEQNCESQDEAQHLVSLWSDLIDHIATKFYVYIRRKPFWETIKDFESSSIRYYAGCRFIVTDPTIKGAGQEVLHRAPYDDGNMITPFGLPPYKETKTRVPPKDDNDSSK